MGDPHPAMPGFVRADSVAMVMMIQSHRNHSTARTTFRTWRNPSLELCWTRQHGMVFYEYSIIPCRLPAPLKESFQPRYVHRLTRASRLVVRGISFWRPI